MSTPEEEAPVERGNGGVPPAPSQPADEKAQRPAYPAARLRRRPNIVAFLSTGAVVGLLASLLLDRVGNTDPRYDGLTSFGFLALGCVAVGVLLGGLVAVLLDRR